MRGCVGLTGRRGFVKYNLFVDHVKLVFDGEWLYNELYNSVLLLYIKLLKFLIIPIMCMHGMIMNNDINVIVDIRSIIVFSYKSKGKSSDESCG